MILCNVINLQLTTNSLNNELFNGFYFVIRRDFVLIGQCSE